MSHSFAPDLRERAGLSIKAKCDGFSRTQQHHAKECDITRIIQRYTRTGELPPGRSRPVFGDVTHLQGDVTERLDFARSTIETANRDLAEHNNKLLSEKNKKQLLKQQKIQEEKQRLERVAALKSELAELEPPPAP